MTLSKPSICFVSPHAHAFFTGHPRGFGGAEVQQALIGRALAMRGFGVCFVSYAPGPAREEEHAGVRIFTLPPPERGGARRLLPFAHREIWRALGRTRADVYYQRCAGTLTGIVALYARRHGKPFLFSVANDRDLDGHFVRTSALHQAMLYRVGVRLATAIVIQSDYQARLLREQWGREGVLIPSACPLPVEPLPAAAERRGAIWVGNMLPKKRPDLLADLAAALPEVPFTMIAPEVGDPAFVRQVIARVDAAPNIKRLPRAPYAEMPRYYREAAMLVSTSSAEGFPNVFLEAWANGLPVISYEIDPDELLCERGLGVHARSLEETALGIARLARDPLQREAIGERAQAYVREHHSPAAVAGRYERLIEEVLKS
jgi:glycosyltransferase involved in cell wall biosynthesis